MTAEQVVTCHQCGATGEPEFMWDDGPMATTGGTVTLYLCQDCHEAQVDDDFWSIVAAHPGIWSEPTEQEGE